MNFYHNLPPGMKRYVRGLGILFFLGVVFSSFTFGFWYLVSAMDIARSGAADQRISVTAEGTVIARPDTALFTVGVITEAAGVKEAQSENSDKSNAILKFLRDGGVAKSDLKTIAYSIRPQYEQKPIVLPSFRDRSPQQIIGYEIRHTVQVKVRDLETTSELLEGVASRGANEVGSISFTIDDMDALEEEAREQAIENAKKKAHVLSRDIGIRLKDIVGFSESGRVPYFARASVESFAFDTAGTGGAAPQVETGEQEIKSTVTITYSFR